MNLYDDLNQNNSTNYTIGSNSRFNDIGFEWDKRNQLSCLQSKDSLELTLLEEEAGGKQSVYVSYYDLRFGWEDEEISDFSTIKTTAARRRLVFFSMDVLFSGVLLFRVCYVTTGPVYSGGLI